VSILWFLPLADTFSPHKNCPNSSVAEQEPRAKDLKINCLTTEPDPKLRISAAHQAPAPAPAPFYLPYLSYLFILYLRKLSGAGAEIRICGSV